MNYKSQNIVLVRIHPLLSFGIDKMGKGYQLDGTPVPLKSYDGRLVYLLGKKQIGYKTMANLPACNFELKENKLPF